MPIQGRGLVAAIEMAGCHIFPLAGKALITEGRWSSLVRRPLAATHGKAPGVLLESDPDDMAGFAGKRGTGINHGPSTNRGWRP